MRVGAGGLVIGIDAQADGTMVCRCDIYVAYVYNRTAQNPCNTGGLGAWQQLFTTAPLPSSCFYDLPRLLRNHDRAQQHVGPLRLLRKSNLARRTDRQRRHLDIDGLFVAANGPKSRAETVRTSGD